MAAAGSFTIDRRRVLTALLAAAVAAPVRAQYRSESWPPGQAVPPLSGAGPDGRHRDLAALRGRPVLINFWATWCAPCKEEMPTLQALADLEGERLAVLAVNVREPRRRVARYLQVIGLRLPVLLDPRGEATRAWGARVFPTTVLVDSAGQPQRVITGALDWTGPQALDWIAALE